MRQTILPLAVLEEGSIFCCAYFKCFVCLLFSYPLFFSFYIHLTFTVSLFRSVKPFIRPLVGLAHQMATNCASPPCSSVREGQDMEVDIQSLKRRIGSLDDTGKSQTKLSKHLSGKQSSDPTRSSLAGDEARLTPLSSQHNTAVDNSQQASISSGTSYPVVLIQSVDGEHIFLNPQKTSDSIHGSIFQKYIIGETLKVLGRGASLRFQVSSLDKIDLTKVTTLGAWKVTCRRPRSEAPESRDVTYGKIGVIGLDYTEDDITNNLRIIGSSTLLEVRRLTSFQNNQRLPSHIIRLKFAGPLPDRVAIASAIYEVKPYIFPVLKCYNCYRYGHGSLTCRSHQRCYICSGFHCATGCQNPPYCFLCMSSHELTSPNCPIHKRAIEISKSYPQSSLGFQSPLISALRALNL